MAIDTSLYGANLPIGTYTKGDIIALKNIRGPAIVRDGYGKPYLKRVISGLSKGNTGSRVLGHVVVINSNWIDETANIATPVSTVSLAENSSNIQRGHDCPLVPNSGWSVKFVVDETVTTTVANSVFALIDVDYPSVQAVQNPRTAPGAPVTIMREDAITTTAVDAIETPVWTSVNVDFLKAGFRYLLVELGSYLNGAIIGFVSISNAAGQQGLERIIPTIPYDAGFMRYLLDYSTPLVKGPMNINFLILANTSASASVLTEIDWVRA